MLISLNNCLFNLPTYLCSAESLLEPQPLKVYRKRKAVVFDEVWAGGLATFVRAKDSGDIYGFGLNNYNQMGELPALIVSACPPA